MTVPNEGVFVSLKQPLFVSDHFSLLAVSAFLLISAGYFMQVQEISHKFLLTPFGVGVK
jgi:hypothetical protein